MEKRTLRGWMQQLEKSGELTRIHATVSPILEISEIADRMVQRGGNALLFEQVEGSPFPLLIGAYAGEERMAHALGVESLDEIGTAIARYLNFEDYASPGQFLRALPRLARLFSCIAPRTPGKADCQHTVNYDPDLSVLPALQCWPEDSGRFLTLPLVFTKLPGGHVQNLGMYRLQLLGPSTAALHWQMHQDGHAIYEAWQQKGGRMPIAVVLGADAAITYAATAPLLPGMDELMLAGFLRKRPVRLVRCMTNDLYIPSSAQFVLEGFIDLDEPPIKTGVFGGHTGYYSTPGIYPVVHFTCMTHCKDPIFPAMLLGRPPKEECFFRRATERIFLPVLRMQIPQLHEMHLPFAGGFHNCAIVSVKQTFPGAPISAIHALWGTGQLRCCKLIIAVDAHVDPTDLHAVLSAVLAHVRPDHDCITSVGPVDALDHASLQPLYGGRLGVDATRKPGRARQPGRLHVIKVNKKRPFGGRDAAFEALERDSGIRIAVAIDAVDACLPQETLLWRVLGDVDAARDFFIRDGRIAIDATAKFPEEDARPWPREAVMSEEMRTKVDARWPEYGIDTQ